MEEEEEKRNEDFLWEIPNKTNVVIFKPSLD